MRLVAVILLLLIGGCEADDQAAAGGTPSGSPAETGGDPADVLHVDIVHELEAPGRCESRGRGGDCRTCGHWAVRVGKRQARLREFRDRKQAAEEMASAIRLASGPRRSPHDSRIRVRAEPDAPFLLVECLLQAARSEPIEFLDAELLSRPPGDHPRIASFTVAPSISERLRLGGVARTSDAEIHLLMTLVADEREPRIDRLLDARPIPVGPPGDTIIGDVLEKFRARRREQSGSAAIVLDVGPLVPWRAVVDAASLANARGLADLRFPPDGAAPSGLEMPAVAPDSGIRVEVRHIGIRAGRCEGRDVGGACRDLDHWEFEVGGLEVLGAVHAEPDPLGGVLARRFRAADRPKGAARGERRLALLAESDAPFAIVERLILAARARGFTGIELELPSVGSATGTTAILDLAPASGHMTWFESRLQIPLKGQRFLAAEPLGVSPLPAGQLGDEVMRSVLRRSFEERPDRSQPSFLVLDVHPRVPWRDVLHCVEIALESGVSGVRFDEGMTR